MTDDVPWLSAEERGAWTALAAVVIKLPGVLDAQLQRDAQLSFFEYMIMAVLSEKEGRSDQMSEIAAATNASLSRLSHAVSRLERAGWIERERLPGADGYHLNRDARFGLETWQNSRQQPGVFCAGGGGQPQRARLLGRLTTGCRRCNQQQR